VSIKHCPNAAKTAALERELAESREDLEREKAARDKLYAALTESRREVEAAKREIAVVACAKNALIAAAEAENATLRQEVERLARSVVEIRGKRDRMAERNKTLGRLIQFDERDRNAEGSTKRRLRDIITHLRRQVEEQAAKLAERERVTIPGLRQELEVQRGNVKAMGVLLEQAESSLAAAQEQVKALEARLPHYHNEKQCGVIAERIEQAESSLAAMTRERDEALAVVAEYKFGQTASARILRERDAALSRAEALSRYAKHRDDCVCEIQGLLDSFCDCGFAALAAPSEPKEGA
jgi:DNA repair exonuclease SbcCD ATPase subunit